MKTENELKYIREEQATMKKNYMQITEKFDKLDIDYKRLESAYGRLQVVKKQDISFANKRISDLKEDFEMKLANLIELMTDQKNKTELYQQEKEQLICTPEIRVNEINVELVTEKQNSKKHERKLKELLKMIDSERTKRESDAREHESTDNEMKEYEQRLKSEIDRIRAEKDNQKMEFNKIREEYKKKVEELEQRLFNSERERSNK